MRSQRLARRATVASGLILASLGAGVQARAVEPFSPWTADEELQVRVAFSPEFARLPGWRARFDCAAGRASELLAGAVGRRLVVRDRVPWRRPSGEEDLYVLRARIVREIDPGGADLVVGLIPAEPEGGDATGRIFEEGLAAYSRGYVVLRVGTDLCSAHRLLAHEVAHVFGGVHRFEPGNLMDHAAPGRIIDELNAALFALHRDRSVRTQPPPLDGGMLRMMWSLARADVAAPETWLKVGVIAASMGKHREACEHYERALTISPNLRVAWVNLGHAQLQLGRFEEARTAYEKALTIAPGDGLVYNNLAVVHLSADDPESALEAVKRARELGYRVPEELLEAIADARDGGS